MSYVCPRCGIESEVLLAKSRTDDKTDVCTPCGTTEALEVAFGGLLPKAAWAIPVLPYNGSSGWSGSDSSRERAEREDSTGVTSSRQEKVLVSLALAGRKGMTWKELGDTHDWHHGQVSGVLSVLHKAGFIARLSETRNRCAVYVSPEFVGLREVVDYTAKQSREQVASSAVDSFRQELLTRVEEWRERNAEIIAVNPTAFYAMRQIILFTNSGDENVGSDTSAD